MSIRVNIDVISSEACSDAHESTLKVLSRTGVVFNSAEAVSLFKRHGAAVEGQTVRISQSMLQKALDSAPKSFTWHGSNPDRSLTVGEGQPRPYVMMDHGPIAIQSFNQGRRQPSAEDLVNLYRLGQASGVVDIAGQVPVAPADLPAGTMHLEITRHLLRSSDKPLMAWPEPAQTLTEMFDMFNLALGGAERLQDHPSVGASVCALSPLAYAPESCGTIIEFAKRGQPLLLLSCAMAGITSPIGLMGSVIQQNAEMLAGLVLAQLINPGAPVAYCPASAVPNLRTGTYIGSSPESSLINMANLQLNRELYRLPTRTMAGLTDTKEVDIQAGYETMQTYFCLLFGGSHLINECLGTLDGIKTVSYEKFMIDEEMLSRILRIMRGVEISGDLSAEADLIGEVKPGGNYLMHPSTIAACRSLWTPSVADWEGGQAKDQNQDIMQRANRRYKEVLANCPQSLIDPGLDQELADYIKRKSQ